MEVFRGLFIGFKLFGRQVETGKKSIFLVKKSKKCQKTAILGQKTIKNEISDLATRKFEVTPNVVDTRDYTKLEKISASISNFLDRAWWKTRDFCVIF